MVGGESPGCWLRLLPTKPRCPSFALFAIFHVDIDFLISIINVPYTRQPMRHPNACLAPIRSTVRPRYRPSLNQALLQTVDLRCLYFQHDVLVAGEAAFKSSGYGSRSDTLYM